MLLTIFIIAVEILLTLLLQTTVFPYFAIGSTIPDLLMIVTAATAYQKGKLPGMATGFFCGLLLDICFGDILGVYALFFMVIGYVDGIMNRYYIRHDLLIPLVMVGASEFVKCLCEYLFRILIHGHVHIFYYMKAVMLPSTIYTVLIAIVLYQLLDLVFYQVLEPEKESDGI